MIPMPVRMKQRATGCLKGILSSRLTPAIIYHLFLPVIPPCREWHVVPSGWGW